MEPCAPCINHVRHRVHGHHSRLTVVRPLGKSWRFLCISSLRQLQLGSLRISGLLLNRGFCLFSTTAMSTTLSPFRNACARSLFSPDAPYFVNTLFTLSHVISECRSPVEPLLFPAPPGSQAHASATPLEHQSCGRPDSGGSRQSVVPSGWSEPVAASSVTFITRS